MEVVKSSEALVLIYKQNATLLKALLSFLNDLRNIYIKKTNFMQFSIMFIDNCKISLHVSVAFCVHLQAHLEL